MVECLYSKASNKTAVFPEELTLSYIDWPKLLAGHRYPLGSLGYSVNGTTVERELVSGNGQVKKNVLSPS
jgi:hypothetical protein